MSRTYLAIFVLMFLVTPTMSQDRQVSMVSLLKEMTSRDEIARFPSPAYTCKQFSSHSRVANNADDKRTWFHNEDWSNYLRIENVKGRTEHVMVDTKGPGAIVRIWVTAGKPEVHKGILRVYIDGSDKPAIEGEQGALISGGALVGAPLSSSSSPHTDYNRRGHNLYLPIPYSKSCKITYEQMGGGRIDRSKTYHYYNINYRTYEQGTNVKSFDSSDLAKHENLLDSLQDKLSRCDGESNIEKVDQTLSGKILAGEKKSLTLTAENMGAAIRELRFLVKAKDRQQALRSTVLEISFDGERTVWCPVGDFFGTGYQIRPTRFWYGNVSQAGVLQCHWTMPFKEKAVVTLHNLGDQTVNLTIAKVGWGGWKWDDRSMHFGSSWYQMSSAKSGGSVNGHGGKGAYDFNYVTLKGKGVYVGDTLTLFDSAQAWWGEGDEKVFVDGEKHPSHFGTGTEDYYGYAWCRGEKFQTPFITQPDGTGDLGVGYVVNGRYRLLDGIPFKKSIKFDMEQWHWAKTHMDIAPTTYWYAIPGTTSSIDPDIEAAKHSVAIRPGDVIPIPEMAKDGIIEGEDLQVADQTGGQAARQELGEVLELQRGAQLWWRYAKVGGKLMLKFKVPESLSGERTIHATLVEAVDYGTFRISLNGKVLVEELDLYATELGKRTIELGKSKLLAGENVIEIVVLKPNKDAKPGNMFGIDFLKAK